MAEAGRLRAALPCSALALLDYPLPAPIRRPLAPAALPAPPCDAPEAHPKCAPLAELLWPGLMGDTTPACNARVPHSESESARLPADGDTAGGGGLCRSCCGCTARSRSCLAPAAFHASNPPVDWSCCSCTFTSESESADPAPSPFPPLAVLIVTSVALVTRPSLDYLSASAPGSVPAPAPAPASGRLGGTTTPCPSLSLSPGSFNRW